MAFVDPYFSVCIPVHNCERYILEALDSIAVQTCPSWEVIVVDDGSNDGTSDLLKAQRVIPAEKMHIITKSQAGQYYARWDAIDAAQGQVIVFLDADDLLVDPSALEKLYQAFASNEADAVTYNACRHLDGTIPFLDYRRLVEKSGHLISREELCAEFCTSDCFNQMPMRAFRRDVCMAAERHNPAFITMAEDRLQLSELYVQCKSAYILDECLYYYRPNDESVSRSSFALKKFQDQVYAEQYLDEAADIAKLKRCNRANAQLNMIVFSDLYWAFSTVSDRRDRKALYSGMREDPFTSEAFEFGTLKFLPKNRRVVLSLFYMGAFGLVDCALSLFECVKAIRDYVKKRSE